MHRLHLLRHAKTEPDEGHDDHERRLSRRGRDDARRLGADLPKAVGKLDLVLCSPARRTRETAELALSGFLPLPPILLEDVLYLAPSAGLLQRLRSLDESAEVVLVIGHNPGLYQLALALAAAEGAMYHSLAAGRFPSAARASFRIEVPWAMLGRSPHPLTAYAAPKPPST
jgi:phosphohistidine phosphatase